MVKKKVISGLGLCKKNFMKKRAFFVNLTKKMIFNHSPFRNISLGKKI